MSEHMLVLATICSNGLSIDRKSRKICFNGIDCIRYRTEGQFNAAYEAVMKILEYCKGDEKSRR